jgi:hypothetical protein
MAKRKFVDDDSDNGYDGPSQEDIANTTDSAYSPPAKPTQRPSVVAPPSAERPDVDFGAINEGPVVAPTISAAKPSNRIVSKKELADSGLSLRDFLNKERGLTRRKSAIPTAEETKEGLKNYPGRSKQGDINVISVDNRPVSNEKEKAPPSRKSSGIVGDEAKFSSINNEKEKARVSRVKNALGMMEDPYEIDKEGARVNRVKNALGIGPTNEAEKEKARVSRVKNALGMGIPPSRVSSGTVGDEPFKRGGKIQKYAEGGGTYVEPERWNKTAASASTRAKELRSQIEKTPRPTMESSVDAAARNSRLNNKESEAEDAEQQALDQYPAGTTSGGRKSRNTAGYDKPVKLPMKKGGVAKYAKGGSIDGCAQRGKTRGTMR